MEGVLIDQKIIKLREEKRKMAHASLSEGMYVNGKVLMFERQDISELFSVMLPVEFFPMPDNFAIARYPSAFRPRFIFTDEELSVDIKFNFLPVIDDADVKATGQDAMEAIKRQNPGYIFTANEKMEELRGYRFDFRSHAFDGDAGNMMMFMRLNNTLLHASFNCSYHEWDDWKPVVIKIWESIEEKERKVF